VYNIAFFLSTPPQAAPSPPYRYGEVFSSPFVLIDALQASKRGTRVSTHALHAPRVPANASPIIKWHTEQTGSESFSYPSPPNSHASSACQLDES
jgi:hypothetical protein